MLPTLEPLIDLLLLKLYSLARVATLITVILNIVDLDITPPSDCQVGASMSHICLSIPVP